MSYFISLAHYPSLFNQLPHPTSFPYFPSPYLPSFPPTSPYLSHLTISPPPTPGSHLSLPSSHHFPSKLPLLPLPPPTLPFSSPFPPSPSLLITRFLYLSPSLSPSSYLSYPTYFPLPTSLIPSPSSHLPHPTSFTSSHLPHPISLIPPPSSHLPPPSSHLPHPTSLIPPPSSHLPHPASLIPPPSSRLPHPTSLIPPSSFNFPHPSSSR